MSHPDAASREASASNEPPPPDQRCAVHTGTEEVCLSTDQGLALIFGTPDVSWWSRRQRVLHINRQHGKFMRAWGTLEGPPSPMVSKAGEQPPIKLLGLVCEVCLDAAKLNSSVCANCSGPPVDPLLNRSANHQLGGWRANWIAVEGGQHIPKLGRQSIRKAKTLEVLVQPQSMAHFVNNNVLRDITPAVAQIEPSHFVVA